MGVLSFRALAVVLILGGLLLTAIPVSSMALVSGPSRSGDGVSGHLPPSLARGPTSGSLSTVGSIPVSANGNSADCKQGQQTITVTPASGDMHSTLLQDYNILGAEGGGTLKLGAGVFQLNETLTLQTYSNVSIQGAGMGRTVLSLPSSPIGNFTADNGSLVGVYNTSLNGPVGGVTANFLQLSGPTPIDHFALCDLTIDAQANNASEDWSGSLIFDNSGGADHVYSDIAEVGFFGPSTTPNGLHLESSAQDQYPGVNYTIDNLVADNNSLPFENYPGFKGGPNFLNVGTVVNCTLDNVVGTGQVAFEVAPPHGCLVENWNISGHITIDPATGGTWGNTLFQNITVNTNGTAATTALGSSVPDGTGREHSNFTGMRWNDDHFYGTVVGAANLVDVENSTFDGELNSTPSVFEGNTVTWTLLNPNSQRLGLPITVNGNPAGGTSSVLRGTTFAFLNAPKSRELFRLLVPTAFWTGDTFEVKGAGTNYLMSAPGVSLTSSSSLTYLTYVPLGSGALANLSLLGQNDSPRFLDLGALVSNLTLISDDLHPLPVAPGSGGLATWIAVSAVTIIGVAVVLGAVFGVIPWDRRRRHRLDTKPTQDRSGRLPKK
ncbi:MAG: hypothetical protein ACLP8Y_01875 [Thermoplasmata archaeon]